ncbi:MAG: hypothetical protein ABSG04_17055 [Verrucomicrobiota bacterium]|jgi:hypothetical protein
MNPGFWQITIGQVVTAVAFVVSAVGFIWRTAALYGQQRAQLAALTEKVGDVAAVVKEQSPTLVELKVLAATSEKRLELIEQQLLFRRHLRPRGGELEAV